MFRMCRRRFNRSFHVIASGCLLVIGAYVIVMPRVLHDEPRGVFSDDEKLTGNLRLRPRAGTQDRKEPTLPSDGVGLHGNASSTQSDQSTAASRVMNSALPHGTTMAALNGSQSSFLLAGTPRQYPVYLTIGIPTLKRQKGDYFFGTLSSLLNQSSPTQQRDLTIVVLLADRDRAHNEAVLARIKNSYPRQLQSGLLLVASAPYTEHIFLNNNIKRTFNDSLQRVRWRSKQNLDYAALMEFCVPLSTYYLQIEDDVLAAPNYLQHIQVFVKANARKAWAGLEVCPHGFIGKLFRCADLPKLVSLLRVFYLEMPCDFLIRHFYLLMLQKDVIRRKGTLFFHQGKYSSLTNVTRKVDKVPNVKAVLKASSGHRNPPASLHTSIKTYKKYALGNAYNGMSSQYFWGVDVVEGDTVTVVFAKPERVDSIVIETGFPGEHGRDEVRNATVEVGRRAIAERTGAPALCTDTQMLGEFKDGHFEAKVSAVYDVKCFTIVITHSQKEWVVIREIAVYTRL